MKITMNSRSLHLLVGISAIAVHFLHILTDLIELINGFSSLQLIFTYIAFLFMPFVILGLYAVQWPKGGWLGLIGIVLYVISFIYFSSTAIYAIIKIKNEISNYEIIYRELGAIYIIHGGLMVIGGILFGFSIIRANILPHITGVLLIAGLLINAIISFLPINPGFQIIGSIIRNIGLIGMGISLIYKNKKINK